MHSLFPHVQGCEANSTPEKGAAQADQTALRAART
jgi:hypothetical protein